GASSPQVSSNDFDLEKPKTSNVTLPSKCHGLKPEIVIVRWTPKSENPCHLKAIEASTSTISSGVPSWNSASRPSRPSRLKPPKPTYSSTFAPNWNVFDVTAMYASARIRRFLPSAKCTARRSSLGSPGGGEKRGWKPPSEHSHSGLSPPRIRIT